MSVYRIETPDQLPCSTWRLLIDGKVVMKNEPHHVLSDTVYDRITEADTYEEGTEAGYTAFSWTASELRESVKVRQKMQKRLAELAEQIHAAS